MKAGRRSRVLCLASYYLPGFKSGGPLRSLLHLQEWLGDDYEFRVVTRDHDLAVPRPYAGVATGRWCPVRGVDVWYLAAPYWSPGAMLKALRAAEADLLYFHSALDPSLTIMPLVLRRLGWLPGGTPVIVAPRGEFSAGARSIKQLKKKVFLAVARALGIYRNVTWHATKEEEAAEIRSLWGADARIAVAPNLPAKVSAEALPRRQAKQPGVLRLAFLSRISPMKNLRGALAMLRGVTASVVFDIYGPQEDPAYWAECEQLLRQLPVNVQAAYRGIVSPGDVLSTLAGYDAFLLPTLGENFGHVILEALLAGCPVLLSDQTPWSNLAASRAGYDLPLDQPAGFQQAIGQFAAMGSAEFEEWSAGAREFGLRFARAPGVEEPTRRMLAAALAP